MACGIGAEAAIVQGKHQEKRGKAVNSRGPSALTKDGPATQVNARNYLPYPSQNRKKRTVAGEAQTSFAFCLLIFPAPQRKSSAKLKP